jgi:probable addiction module antidote protein
LAAKSGLSRESLYRALSEDGNPRLDTLMKVLTALGIKLTVAPANTNAAE